MMRSMAGPQDGRQLNLGVQFPCPWKPFPDAAGWTHVPSWRPVSWIGSWGHINNLSTFSGLNLNLNKKLIFRLSLAFALELAPFQFGNFLSLPLRRGLSNPEAQILRAASHKAFFLSSPLDVFLARAKKPSNERSASAIKGWLTRRRMAAKSLSELEVPAPVLARPAFTRVLRERTSWPFWAARFTDSFQQRKSLWADSVWVPAIFEAYGQHSVNCLQTCKFPWCMRSSSPSAASRNARAKRSNIVRLCSYEGPCERPSVFNENAANELVSSNSGHSAEMVARMTSTQARIRSKHLDLSKFSWYWLQSP